MKVRVLATAVVLLVLVHVSLALGSNSTYCMGQHRSGHCPSYTPEASERAINIILKSINMHFFKKNLLICIFSVF